MPEDPKYPDYQPHGPSPDVDELDEATLDRVVGGLDSPKELQETLMGFPLVNPQVQNGLQDANREYTAVSNIMKTKHDTVKNSISNIR